MIENIIAAVIVFLSLGFVVFILAKAAGDRKGTGCRAGCAFSASCGQSSCPERNAAGSDNESG